MIDRFGKEIDFSELFMEETLSAKDKKELPDSMYGLVYTDDKGNKVRKFPLNDESHVRQAAIFFDRAKDLTEDQKRELARNIVRRAKELDMDYSGWESLKPYLDKADKPIKESFEEMFGPVIQEAATRDEKMIPIKPPKTDEVYFGSPTNHMPEIDLDRPLFVSPYKGIASIFIWGDMGLQDRIPKGSYNLNYEEWINFDEKKMNTPLKEVHVYLEGAPFLEPFTVEQEGYIHCISTKDYIDNFFRKPWMTKDLEYLIANTDNMKVAFTRSIKCKVKYYIKGKPAPKGKQYGPSKNGILRYIHEIADKIHAKYKADQKEPTGNQNCLLCSWCAEASIRGGEYLPRPIYSPRDSALEIEPESMITGIKRVNLKGGYQSLLSHIKTAKEPFARWYCHVQWSNSNGGHEFLIVKIDDNSFEIMDAQQGTVKPLNADDYHVKDIDWNESYICRIDDKPFKYMKLDQINDPKKTLPWDPKKDIPYMVKHGLCTKEEAEKELKKTETNLFNSELKKALGQTPIQEGLFFKKKEYHPLEISEVYQEFVNAYNDPVFKAIISEFKDRRSSLLSKWMNDAHPVDEVFTEEDNDGLVSRFLSKTQVDNFEVTNSRYETIGYGFATVRNPDEWLTISKVDGKVYYCNIRPDSIIADSFNEFLSSFGSTFKQYLTKANKPIQEGHTDLLDETFYRFEYDGEGIYEALHKKMTMDEWKKFKSSSAATWLPVPPNYQTGDQSFFTEKGYDKFMNLTYPYMTKYLKKSKIRKFETELNPKYIRYRDEYQVVFNKTKTFQESTIQEGAWNDIRNGVNPWSKKRVFHITKQGHLDGQIFKPRVPEYLDKYDPSQDKFEDVDNPRICFSNSIEGALNAIIVNIGRWKTANKLGDWYVYVPEKPLKEYKYRTTRQLVDEKKVYDANVTNEIWIEEPVRLKQYGIIHVDQVSDKHTRKTVPTTTGFVGHRYRYDFKYHWLVKPKVIADLPYDYSPKSVCEDMVNELSGFKYGLGYDGSIHHGSSKDFDEKYRLESPEEFEKNGGGICYDYVEWEAGYLEAYGYTCRKFFISTDTKDMDTHTFILVDDGKGGFIYPEAAFKPMEGVYEVKSPEEAALKVMNHIFDINDNDKKYDEIKYYVWEYKGHPPYGSDMETCHKYFTKGEPFHEGTAKKLKRKE